MTEDNKKPKNHTLDDHMFGEFYAHEHDGIADHDHDNIDPGPLEDNPIWQRDNVEFLGESSDVALPPLAPGAPVDVALMDGNHSFPFPMLDFHFIDRQAGIIG